MISLESPQTGMSVLLISGAAIPVCLSCKQTLNKL